MTAECRDVADFVVTSIVCSVGIIVASAAGISVVGFYRYLRDDDDTKKSQ